MTASAVYMAVTVTGSLVEIHAGINRVATDGHQIYYHGVICLHGILLSAVMTIKMAPITPIAAMTYEARNQKFMKRSVLRNK
jgi:hypothetical protein